MIGLMLTETQRTGLVTLRSRMGMRVLIPLPCRRFASTQQRAKGEKRAGRGGCWMERPRDERATDGNSLVHGETWGGLLDE